MRVQPPEPDSACTVAVGVVSDGERTRYYDGLPPELTGGVDLRRELPPAVLVLLAPYGDGRWDVDRYAGDGSHGGSTHHDSWAEVVAQLRAEYVSDLAVTLVPADVVDVHGYASELSAQHAAG